MQLIAKIKSRLASPFGRNRQLGASMTAVMMGVGAMAAGAYVVNEMTGRGEEAAQLVMENQARRMLADAVENAAGSVNSLTFSATDSRSRDLNPGLRDCLGADSCRAASAVPMTLFDGSGSRIAGPANDPALFSRRGENCALVDPQVRDRCPTYRVTAWYDLACPGGAGACSFPENIRVNFRIAKIDKSGKSDVEAAKAENRGQKVASEFDIVGFQDVAPFKCSDPTHVIYGYNGDGTFDCRPPISLKGPGGDRGPRGDEGLRGPAGAPGCQYAQNSHFCHGEGGGTCTYINVFHQFGYPDCRPRYVRCDSQQLGGRKPNYPGCPGGYLGLARGLSGCFAPDTLILMGDGKSMKQAADVRKGDGVWNPVLRRAVEVVEVYLGPEKLPLIEIEYQGSLVRVTREHPMRTWNGPRQAHEIKTGDALILASGQTVKVEKVRETKADPELVVYNFELRVPGKAKDAAGKAAYVEDEHWVLSDGVITGDIVMQRRLAAERSKLLATEGAKKTDER